MPANLTANRLSPLLLWLCPGLIWVCPTAKFLSGSQAGAIWVHPDATRDTTTSAASPPPPQASTLCPVAADRFQCSDIDWAFVFLATSKACSQYHTNKTQGLFRNLIAVKNGKPLRSGSIASFSLVGMMRLEAVAVHRNYHRLTVICLAFVAVCL